MPSCLLVWAHRDLNPEPADYESDALTIELWARHHFLFWRAKIIGDGWDSNMIWSFHLNALPFRSTENPPGE